MLAKEDVLLWFKDLESYKRIDVMYELLNMCMPFEVRFLGSCIEEIGKHTYQELRGASIAANDMDRLSKDPSLQSGLADESTRHRAVIYMSVLSARNSACANWFSTTLFRTADPIEHVLKVTGSREQCQNVVSELLLLYTLGLYHPAFTFDQRTAFSNVIKRLQAIIMYHSSRNFSSHNEPMKAMSPADSLPHPPGLPPMSLSYLSRTAFPATGSVVGAPEVRPFSAQSGASHSPPQSRDLSPHPSLRPMIITGMPPAITSPIMPHVAIDTAAHNCEEEVKSQQNTPNRSLQAEKPILQNHFISEETNWSSTEQLKQTTQNGLRGFANMKLEGSVSNSSSSSSRNASPTETPPHGPGRGGANNNSVPVVLQQAAYEAKTRVNGLPTTFMASCEPPFSSVPSFSNYHRYYIRPHFASQFPQLGSSGAEVIYTIPCVYSNNVPPPPPRNLNCCNCGGIGHLSVDCSEQSVESLTQPHYTLEYEPAPDNASEK